MEGTVDGDGVADAVAHHFQVLVFDDLGRDVISSVLRVNDLRAWGVTSAVLVAIRTCLISGL
jgi:ABC-type antimicrobial peptide transport system permease subunit